MWSWLIFNVKISAQQKWWRIPPRLLSPVRRLLCCYTACESIEASFSFFFPFIIHHCSGRNQNTILGCIPSGVLFTFALGWKPYKSPGTIYHAHHQKKSEPIQGCHWRRMTLIPIWFLTNGKWVPAFSFFGSYTASQFISTMFHQVKSRPRRFGSIGWSEW
jgi:hypothetical protein